MNNVDELNNKQAFVAVVGLGYVGLPLAAALAEHFKVIGFDNNEAKISLLKSGVDPTMEIGDEKLQQSQMFLTSDERELAKANFIIVAVPTPIKVDHTPDLDPVLSASKIVGKNLSRGTIVVYESTVYPGVTEELCVKELEQVSQLKCGEDFFIGYSPERINPGDKVHRLKNICKIVSGMNDEVCDEIEKLYATIVDRTYKAKSIKIAEAAKLLENTQRDINIAFVNEAAMIFDKMGISTKEVIDAMNTKWNSLGFCPGLVGGHCIGIDPYYLIYKASVNNSSSELVSFARKINNNMSRFFVDAILQKLIQERHAIKNDKIYLFGITFKENCPDIRNSRVIDIINMLKDYHITLNIVDPYADKALVKKLYGIDLIDYEQIDDADCLIFTVAHDVFTKFSADKIKAFTKNSYDGNKSVIIDIKNIYDKQALEAKGLAYWGL